MVMMEQAFWLILFLAVVGIAALIAAAMMWQKESIQQPGTPTGQRSYQEEYSAPDFTESAGFAVTMYPSTDILIPGRFWLINRKTAEIEYNVIPAGGVRLRVAQTGQLDVPSAKMTLGFPISIRAKAVRCISPRERCPAGVLARMPKRSRRSRARCRAEGVIFPVKVSGNSTFSIAVSPSSRPKS